MAPAPKNWVIVVLSSREPSDASSNFLLRVSLALSSMVSYPHSLHTSLAVVVLPTPGEP